MAIASTPTNYNAKSCDYFGWYSGVCNSIGEGIANLYESGTYGTIAIAPPGAPTPKVPTIDPTTGLPTDSGLAVQQTFNSAQDYINYTNDFLNQQGITGQNILPTATWFGDYGIYLVLGIGALVLLEKI